ncbi:MAG: ABC transporter ATP-binding protein [Shewanella sp.]|nr:ABC transporter ATP-binding protein [Shewanella sp.]
MTEGSYLTCSIKIQNPVSLEADLHCKAGNILAILGPSGAGKSTLLKVLAGLIKPASGTISVGKNLWSNVDSAIHLSPQQRHIGYVPQHFGLFEHLSTIDNILIGLKHLPKSERQAQANKWLRLVDLSAQKHKRPNQLSGGQRQRVALARALARKPSVLLLDEPFSAVDNQTREMLHIALLKLKTEIRCPVIMVTHNYQEAMLLADNILIVESGKTIQQGTVNELLQNPHSMAVARQLGVNNIFPVTVVRHDPYRQLTWFSFAGYTLYAKDNSLRNIGDTVTCLLPHRAQAHHGITDVENSQVHLEFQLISSYDLHNNTHILGFVIGSSIALKLEIDRETLPTPSSTSLYIHFQPEDIRLIT